MAFIKINKQNFYHNLNQIALQTRSVDSIAIVLKDNAYGHDLNLMAKLSSEFGIKHAVVRNMSEAKHIKTLFETILILGDKIIKDDVYSFTINELEDIRQAQEGAKVELKIDTGMHRNGIRMEEIYKALSLIKEQKLILVGVMTHYRSADLLSSELFWQKKQFEQVKEIIKRAGFKKIRFHSYNSAAILRSKNFDEDLIRVGIGAYGYNELGSSFDKIVLKPVLSLHAKKVSSRVLKVGERIGYCGDFMATEELSVSTYDLGYGDGWFRGENQKNFITSEGLSILGRVSMDFITLASVKEEVCIMENAQKVAKHFSTISYEVTTSLSNKIVKILI